MSSLWLLPSAAHTEVLGAALAQALALERNTAPARAPWLLYLSGPLGAGKTSLAAALLHELGVVEAVRSPSYALVELYELSQLQVAHIDLYRLHGASELEQIGLRDYLQPGTLIVVEWPERALQALPTPDLSLTLALAQREGRECRAQAHSQFGRRWQMATDSAVRAALS